MIKNIIPYKHQKDALELSRRSKEIALFFDMGTGKTLSTLLILDDKIKQLGVLPRTLIIGPLSVVYNWKNEFKKYTDLRPENIIVPTGTGKQKVEQLQYHLTEQGLLQARKIVVVNYDSLNNEAILKTLDAWCPEFLVCDESHLVKNPKARRSKHAAQLADSAIYKMILTGTPIANTPADAFMQYRVLDGGKTFGRNHRVFMSRYFVDENMKRVGTKGYFPKLIPRQEMFDELSRKIFSKALRVKKADCLDLPPRIEQTVYVDMNEAQMKAYKDMKRDFVASVQDALNKGENKTIIATMAMTKAMKMQQIVTGFALADDGSIIDFGSVPRLLELEDLLTQLTPENKVIVWTCFKYNIKQIVKMLDKCGIKWVKLDGEMNGVEKQEAVNAFETDNSVRVIVANRKAGGTGINLVQAGYSIVYSKTHSLIEESQSRDRNYRGGSQIHDQVVKIDLCSKGTIDEQINEAIVNKEDLANRILDIIKEI